jgi:hypothetical protein
MAYTRIIERIINKNIQSNRTFAIINHEDKSISFLENIVVSSAPKEAKKNMIDITTKDGLLEIKKALEESIERGWEYI